ncbi:hypothetical protein TNCV_66281 [Trichonephila clavipes]|nr:hypothetical protein TNCV_66281 [Trichonephila clavipes]
MLYAGTLKFQSLSHMALQWVPSHVGIPDNERADQKAKQERFDSIGNPLLTPRRARTSSPHTLTIILP